MGNIFYLILAEGNFFIKANYKKFRNYLNKKKKNPTQKNKNDFK